jgi:hypothetical protein
MTEPRSRVFRTVVQIEVLAIVAEGVPLTIGEGVLHVPKGDGREHPSKFDPEAAVRDGLNADDIGPDIYMVAGESAMTAIEELSP